MLLYSLLFYNDVFYFSLNAYFNFALSLTSIFFAINVTLIFLLIVLISVTVPSLRLETLSSSSWLLGLTFIGFWVVIYSTVWVYL